MAEDYANIMSFDSRGHERGFIAGAEQFRKMVLEALKDCDHFEEYFKPTIEQLGKEEG